MATRLEQDAKWSPEEKLFQALFSRHIGEKSAPVVRTALPRLALAAISQELSATEVEQEANLSPLLPLAANVQGTVLWNTAVESLGRSASVLE